uniref:Uncharacterized protein n=1 Tax=Chromera velia CCMP2878 TaxID=1169474 RepID=A0A0G4GPA7_9ALVE|eukprot:Cvel_22776.t1-p1 / transcript=Cvel_22776.t1 / gene=Cvel_22776 / organism=Chromera_velia_CCMP2878 / gene_product=hypothetical protein / transcript_product=hypothetical protein / location=Cvel_scaffold2276:29143-29424(+) / protein_length=94 / sequence_SO=supercontig / SO=protein_coding / is_pseudo=false
MCVQIFRNLIKDLKMDVEWDTVNIKPSPGVTATPFYNVEVADGENARLLHSLMHSLGGNIVLLGEGTVEGARGATEKKNKKKKNNKGENGENGG